MKDGQFLTAVTFAWTVTVYGGGEQLRCLRIAEARRTRSCSSRLASARAHFARRGASARSLLCQRRQVECALCILDQTVVGHDAHAGQIRVVGSDGLVDLP